jgi:pimeloyl-ACP methyl ester carboxylesterase
MRSERVNHCWWFIMLLLIVAFSEARGAAPARKGIAEVNGTRLYYEVAGDGFPLVLISGGGLLDCRAWDDQFEIFAKSFQVIRYDIRGIGKSARPLSPFSHSHDLYMLLRFLQVRRAHIVGLSFGGGIAVDFALEHPEMVDHLVLAATGTSSDAKGKTNLDGLAALAAMVKKDGLARVVDVVLSTPSFIARGNATAQDKIRQIYFDNRDVFESAFPLVRFWNPTAPQVSKRLPEIRAASLILIAANDSPDDRAITEKLAAGISRSKKVIIPGASHVINLDKPKEFNQAVLKFLNEP